MEFSTSITHTCTYVRLQHYVWALNAEPGLKILKIQGALLEKFSNVNQSGTDMLQKTETFTMNANLAQKSSRLKGMLSVKFSNMSGPKILKIQRSSIGDVLRAMWGCRYALEHHWCTILAPKKSKSLHQWIHRDTWQCESLAQKSSRSKVWQHDSGPQILKNQRGFIGEVWGCD